MRRARIALSDDDHPSDAETRDERLPQQVRIPQVPENPYLWDSRVPLQHSSSLGTRSERTTDDLMTFQYTGTLGRLQKISVDDSILIPALPGGACESVVNANQTRLYPRTRAALRSECSRYLSGDPKSRRLADSALLTTTSLQYRRSEEG